MGYTVVGLFDNASQVTEVKRQLVALGIPENNIRLTAQPAANARGSASTAGEPSLWQEFKALFTGDDHHYAEYYAEGARRGGTVVSVEAPEAKVERVAEILRTGGAVDLDQRVPQWRSSGWTGAGAEAGAKAAAPRAFAGASATQQKTGQGKMAVPVVEEQMDVGKRQVQSGGVRIVRRVTERPVSKDINLTEEHVTVDRRPVQRDLSGKDLDEAFRDKTIEVTETAEVPVAQKTARVVEEVVVNKDVEQRKEQVRDTVRRTDVDVERLPGREASERTGKAGETDVDETSSTKRKSSQR